MTLARKLNKRTCWIYKDHFFRILGKDRFYIRNFRSIYRKNICFTKNEKYRKQNYTNIRKRKKNVCPFRYSAVCMQILIDVVFFPKDWIQLIKVSTNSTFNTHKINSLVKKVISAYLSCNIYKPTRYDYLTCSAFFSV